MRLLAIADLPQAIMDFAPNDTSRVSISPPTGGCSSATCGVSDATLDAALQARIADHPCYSEAAHHHYARMHVAVAPKCNIQCNYCNRKFDCANESRPGVVSELLTPEEALHKVLVVGSEITQLSVVGIAGPGDPLANPERTFRTFELIAQQAPDLKLCLSTNGLMLPDYLDRIQALNIDHVTLTINMVDPAIGAQIYPWVRYHGKYYKGLEAARILHERQMQSLDLLHQADILCKVNSVAIPGINDQHLPEVNRVIRQKGAFVHNIMPLISAPEHGTYFGRTGQRGPTPAELKALQDQCAGNMNVMRHCRQCRADAIGLLGEDRALEFTKAKVLQQAPTYDPQARQAARAGIEQFRAILRQAHDAIQTPPQNTSGPSLQVAVATRGQGMVNQHFGHAKEFMIYEVDAATVRFVGHRKVDQYCQGGYGESASLAGIVNAIADCQAVLALKVGPCPQQVLQAAGIQVVETYDVIEQAARDVYRRYLSQQSPPQTGC